MRAFVLAALLLCPVAATAQPDPALDAPFKFLEEAADPAIRSSFGLAAVIAIGTALPTPGSEDPSGHLVATDGFTGFGTARAAIERPFIARGTVTAGYGRFSEEGLVSAESADLEGVIAVVMSGGFRDLYAVSGSGLGTVSVSGRMTGALELAPFANLFSYSPSGELLDFDGVSTLDARDFELTVDTAPGADVVLVLIHLFGPLEAVQDGPPVSDSFEMVVDQVRASEGLDLHAVSGALRPADGGYVYAAIPEPSTPALLWGGPGVLGLWAVGRRAARTRPAPPSSPAMSS